MDTNRNDNFVRTNQDIKRTNAICINACDIKNMSSQKTQKLNPGNLVCIQGKYSNFSKITVRNEEDDIWSKKIFACRTENIMTIPEKTWPFLTAIRNPDSRLDLAMNIDCLKWIMSLNVNNIVGYTQNNQIIDCVVVYIGSLPELRKGLHFGLKFLQNINLENKQFIDNSECDLFVTADSLIKSDFSQPNLNFWNMQTNCKFEHNNSHENNYNDIKSLPKPYMEPTSTNFSKTLTLRENVNQNKTDSQNKEIKPNTIFNLDKKDIVVIDKEDIKESTKDAKNINIVERNVKKSTIPNKQSNKSTEIDTTKNNQSFSKDVLSGPNEVKQRTNEFSENPLPPIPLQKIPGSDLEIGSLVIVDHKKISQKHGVIRWIGILNPKEQDDVHVGVELEDIQEAYGDGYINGIKLFECQIGRGLVIGSNFCKKDSRFEDDVNIPTTSKKFLSKSQCFGEKKCENLTGNDLEMIPTIRNNKFAEKLLPPIPLQNIPGSDLEIGSLVIVDHKKISQKHGVIRWIGILNPKEQDDVHVGVELEDIQEAYGDGYINGIKLFECEVGRGLVIGSNFCKKDSRFEDDVNIPTTSEKFLSNSQCFGEKKCESITGNDLPTIKNLSIKVLKTMCGRNQGIQGHHNSCYLDATLFSMFKFTELFDSLLFRVRQINDSNFYENVQKVLREDIINPLRKNNYVRADHVMKLRQLLDKFCSGTSYTTEKKNPGELLNHLLKQVLRAEPFLKLSSGQEAFYYQLFVVKNDKIERPTVQQLFDQSFRLSDIKFKEVPSCLIIQMPRFGKNYKMYNSILPTQLLEITDFIEDFPRQCSVCENVAEIECRDCMMESEFSLDIFFTFCKICFYTTHNNDTDRRHHREKRKICTPPDFKKMQDCKVPRLFMELFAVICIETSHYVSFVKTGTGNNIPWCFFDSMAERIGEKNGYNIPEIIYVPEVTKILNDEPLSSDKYSKHAKLLLSDAYMCMYQSTDVMMYKKKLIF